MNRENKCSCDKCSGQYGLGGGGKTVFNKKLKPIKLLNTGEPEEYKKDVSPRLYDLCVQGKK